MLADIYCTAWHANETCGTGPGDTLAVWGKCARQTPHGAVAAVSCFSPTCRTAEAPHTHNDSMLAPLQAAAPSASLWPTSPRCAA